MADSMSAVRTKKAITDALIRLTLRMPFERITVQDILKETPVSRYTFYAHFHDKYEVAEALQAQQYERFLEFLSQRPKGDDNSQVDAAVWEYNQREWAATQALQRIHTERVDFVRLINDFFEKEYRLRFEDHPHLELEAAMYGNIMSAVQAYFSVHYAADGGNFADALSEAHINIALNGLGIHDETDKAEAARYLLALQEKNHKNRAGVW